MTQINVILFRKDSTKWAVECIDYVDDFIIRRDELEIEGSWVENFETVVAQMLDELGIECDRAIVRALDGEGEPYGHIVHELEVSDSSDLPF